MTHHPALLELCRRDPRYAYEAYLFLLSSLTHTQQMLDRVPTDQPGPEHHVSGAELVRGMVDLARRDFGLMAGVVFKLWGVRESADIGELVFNLIDAKIFSKTEGDSKDDFRDVCDFEEEWNRYEIHVGTAD